MNVCIKYSVIYSPARNDGSMFLVTTYDYNIATQMLLAVVQVHLFMQHYVFSWDPSCTDFMKPESAVDDFVGRTMTDL